jgi:hypothetical protein
MKTLLTTALPMALRLLFAATAMISADYASAAPNAVTDTCQFYGYVPHTRDYAVCRMNVRHYWSTGLCSDNRFAMAHRRYCNLIPTLDF